MNRTDTRIYIVEGPEGKERLVRTTHRAYALAYIMHTTYRARVANQNDLERLLPNVIVEIYNPRTPKGGDRIA